MKQKLGVCKENHLWRWVIVAKYGLEGGGWSSLKLRGSHGCGLWKGIMLGRDLFFQHIELVPGQGDRILFWHDSWCGMTPLKTLFPVLFSCSSDKSASLASLLSRSGEGDSCVWNFSFIRDFNAMKYWHWYNMGHDMTQNTAILHFLKN